MPTVAAALGQDVRVVVALLREGREGAERWQRWRDEETLGKAGKAARHLMRGVHQLQQLECEVRPGLGMFVQGLNVEAGGKVTERAGVS